jgi:hypothetical protein
MRNRSRRGIAFRGRVDRPAKPVRKDSCAEPDFVRVFLVERARFALGFLVFLGVRPLPDLFFAITSSSRLNGAKASETGILQQAVRRMDGAEARC